MIEDDKDSTTTCLNLLLEAFAENNEELNRKTLYALSSAMRGNVDVQSNILNFNSAAGSTSFFLARMEQLSSEPNISPKLMRKIWALISDMLDERNWIRLVLIPSTSVEDQKEIEVLENVQLIGKKIIF